MCKVHIAHMCVSKHTSVSSVEVRSYFSTPGRDETELEKLRSILIQMEYQYQVNNWHAHGVPFKDHLHVPEVHPDTQMMFCKREDEGHVFKVSHAQANGNMHSYVHVHVWVYDSCR